MASKKFLELKDFSLEELRAELDAIQTEYKNLKFDNALKGLDNPLVIRERRRDIARLNTEIRRRELEACTPEELASRSKIRARRRKS